MSPRTATPPPSPDAPSPSTLNGKQPATARTTRPLPAQAAGSGSITPPPKLRRRPKLIALGVALVALGGAGAAYLATAVGHTHSVLAVRGTLTRGSVIGASDLVTANINTDPALRPIPAAQRAQVIGQHTAVDLAAGSLITPDALTSAVVPASGRSLVGVSLTPAQLPAQPLRPGDTVRLVDTPRAQDDPPQGEPPSTTATVVQAYPPGDRGERVVDVTVPAGEAVSLAARAATGRVALVVDAGTG